jgi:hypothetical protein
MKNSQKGFAVPIIIAIVALLVFGGGYVYYKSNEVITIPESPLPNIINSVPTPTSKINTSTTPINNQPIACTMDTKQCPDGSYVGRSGPNCEFVCPIINTDVPPPLGNSRLQIICNNKGCNTSGVNLTRSDFYVTSNGKQIKVLIDIETRLRYVLSDFENGVLTETELLKKWAEFYPLLKATPETIGMPSSFNATIYGDWVDENTFKANWIKWGVNAG